MKIISDFHDYYDGVQKLGMDKLHVYNRKCDDISCKKYNEFLAGLEHIIKPSDYLDKTLHNQYLYQHRKSGYNKESYIICVADIPFFFVDLQTSYSDECFQIHITEEQIQKHFSNKKYKNYIHYYIPVLKKIIESKKLSNINFEYRTPVLLIKRDMIILNPCLKLYKFFKYMDTYTIYQKLEMFIGNILVKDTEVEVPVGTDKDIAISKGYDKFSFRKEKE